MQTSAISRLTSLCGALALGAALLPAASMAQSAAKSAQEQYRLDVQRCNAGQTNQDRRTCLQEAGAALEESRRNRLDDKQQGRYDQNALNRCSALPAAQQQDCMTQMQSPTRVHGSVMGGGVLRETIIQVPAGTPGSTPSSGYAPAPAAAPGSGYAPAPAPASGYAPPPNPGYAPAQPPGVVPAPGGGLTPAPAVR
ncbi:hypothetical protein [Bordetella genomosp. 13]|uniref:Uncharacterized protein n=1 Tax=Bordetella genomosp. 13 TaxID=463040 RepID=A0A1W6ZDT3_9BORD|nr:hypothetical protein [Bordetella genomosp. 13]ARP95425.1 hypothetical protein CAL15_14150 [Bordetella genomosp. 13]